MKLAAYLIPRLMLCAVLLGLFWALWVMTPA